jgi:hypothetical protein
LLVRAVSLREWVRCVAGKSCVSQNTHSYVSMYQDLIISMSLGITLYKSR